MAEKSQLEVGQRVRFMRSHDRNVTLTGKIVKIHEDSDSVDIQTEPDGKIAEIETTETAHAADVTPIADVTAISSENSGAADESEGEDTGTESHRSRRRR